LVDLATFVASLAAWRHHTLMHTPLSVVIAQLEGYNARDIDAFAGTFTDDIIVYDLETPAGSATDVPSERFRGIAALRARYGAQFTTHPNQRSTVVSRQVLGDYVFDLEYITGNSPTPEVREPRPYHLMAIYRVCPNRGKINRCWFTPRV
jgi:hypothetical protein